MHLLIFFLMSWNLSKVLRKLASANLTDLIFETDASKLPQNAPSEKAKNGKVFRFQQGPCFQLVLSALSIGRLWIPSWRIRRLPRRPWISPSPFLDEVPGFKETWLLGTDCDAMMPCCRCQEVVLWESPVGSAVWFGHHPIDTRCFGSDSCWSWAPCEKVLKEMWTEDCWGGQGCINQVFTVQGTATVGSSCCASLFVHWSMDMWRYIVGKAPSNDNAIGGDIKNVEAPEDPQAVKSVETEAW